MKGSYFRTWYVINLRKNILVIKFALVGDMCGVYVLMVLTRVLKYQVFSGILRFLLGETKKTSPQYYEY